MYLFVFIALLQTFVIFNGINQMDLVYSERMVQIEKKFENYKNKITSERKIDVQKDVENKLTEKMRSLEKSRWKQIKENFYLLKM